MRKNTLYKLLGLTLLFVSLIGCDTAKQDVEPIVSPDGYPTASFVNVTGKTTVTEGDTLVFNITIDKMIDRAITFTFEQTGGTADEDDFTAVPAVLQPYTKSAKLLIITHQDYDFTSAETLSGEISVLSIAERYLLNAATVFPAPSITINNYVSPDLELAFYWDQDVPLDGDVYDAADHIDFDFIVADAAGFDITDPWSNDIGIYDAATGSHPEELVLSGLPNGEYIIFVDLWSNDFAGESNTTTKINIWTYLTRQGTSLIEKEIELPEANRLVADQDAPYNAVICKIVVGGGKYTIYDAANTSLGSFKSLSVKTKRPANTRKN
jgi:hypothetical protein